MKLLALDPSSTVIGYAVGKDARVFEAGRIKPSLAGAPRHWPGAVRRAMAMSSDLLSLLDEHHPEMVLVEVPDGKVHGNKRHTGGAGQSLYGLGVGVVLRTLWDRVPADRLEMVSPNTWTRRRRKADRARELAAVMPGYARVAASGGDMGLDCADAIEMLQWWFTQRLTETGR